MNLGIGLLVGNGAKVEEINSFSDKIKTFKQKVSLFILDTSEEKIPYFTKYAEHIYRVGWRDDFSYSRNTLMGMIHNLNLFDIDFLLFLDLDEEISQDFVDYLHLFLEGKSAENKVYAIKINNMIETNVVASHYHTRLIPMKVSQEEFDKIVFKGRIHEAVQENVVFIEGGYITHKGYQENDGAKIERNLRLISLELKDIKDLRNREERDNRKFFLYYNRVILYSLQGDFSKTYLQLQDLKKLYSGRKNTQVRAGMLSYAYTCLGNLYMKRKDYKEGLKCMEECFKIDRTSPSNMFLHAGFLYYLKEYEFSFEILRMIIEGKHKNIQLINDPSVTTWKAMRLLGKVFYKLGIYLEAIRCFSNITITDDETLILLKKCYEIVGEKELAHKIKVRE